MVMLTNLADILRGAGLNVVETAGWKTRGHGQMSGVRGVLWHHTATAASAGGDYPSQRIVTDGRSDLPGPLCNLGLGRSGTWYCVAAGMAYHAGAGSWPGIGTNGNGYLIGVEAEYPGTAGALWPGAQIDSYRRGTAALLRAFGLGADRMIFHREWAPTRKIDPSGLDPNAERRFVAGYMTNPAPTPQGGFLMALSDADQNDLLGRVRGLEQTHREVHDLHETLMRTPDVNADGKPGDVGYAQWVQYQFEVTEDLKKRVAAVDAKLDKLITAVGAK